jgi:hypothetical protein
MAVLGEKMLIRTSSGDREMDTLELAFNKLREQVAKDNLKAIAQTFDEMRRLMAPPPATTKSEVGERLSPAEQLILDRLLDAQGLAPMVIGKPIAAGEDILSTDEQSASDDEEACEQDSCDPDWEE